MEDLFYELMENYNNKLLLYKLAGDGDKILYLLNLIKLVEKDLINFKLDESRKYLDQIFLFNNSKIDLYFNQKLNQLELTNKYVHIKYNYKLNEPITSKVLSQEYITNLIKNLSDKFNSELNKKILLKMQSIIVNLKSTYKLHVDFNIKTSYLDLSTYNNRMILNYTYILNNDNEKIEKEIINYFNKNNI